MSLLSNLILAGRLSLAITAFHLVDPRLIPRDLPLRVFAEERREVSLSLLRETRRQALNGTLVRPHYG